jgi:carbon storage regulator CsrA
VLVITRRPNEKIRFPALNITVHILRSTARAIRVGIEAPPEVQVFREELCPASAPVPAPPKSDHALANALSRATLAIHLAQKQWEAGRSADAEGNLELALQVLAKLDRARQSVPATRCKALIVEDDDNERALLAGLLGMNGCECATAADGEDAMGYLEAGGRPDVILVDMAMPRCDGPETLRRIRADERFSGLPVFSVSSTSPQELNIPFGPNGFDAWFAKPLNPRLLWDAIQTAVRSPASAN